MDMSLLVTNDFSNQIQSTLIASTVQQHPLTHEKLNQAAFDNLIVNLLNTLSHATSLKYLDTSSSSYLQR
ncbi:unnamed protein product [Rotaria magnacalcarata]|uniref:Uncharacterized protein n=2 Tax=Rotaria magnacalcarata TaxID=392030 RepID=A0A816T5B9_9BILA|nr:unnamed protein product [Rotaria magnacalcarata]